MTRAAVSLAPRTGLVSWYGINDGSGRVTASGARFDPHALGMAHSNWPFGTRVRVTVLATGRSAVLTVTDRNGPGVARGGRFADLYFGSAKALGIVGAGVAAVHAEPLTGAAGAAAVAAVAPGDSAGAPDGELARLYPAVAEFYRTHP